MTSSRCPRESREGADSALKSNAWSGVTIPTWPAAHVEFAEHKIKLARVTHRQFRRDPSVCPSSPSDAHDSVEDDGQQPNHESRFDPHADLHVQGPARMTESMLWYQPGRSSKRVQSGVQPKSAG